MANSERIGCMFWPDGRLKLIEPVQFLYSLYLSGSMSLVSQAVRYLIKSRSQEHELTKEHELTDIGGQICRNASYGAGSNSEVEAEAARWLMYMNIAVVIPAFFSTIFLGGLSNRVGRKQVLLLPLIGAFLRLFIFVLVFSLNLHMAFLVLSSVVDGFFGMSCAMIMACYCYTSDITSHQHRSIRIVLLQVCSGVALIVSSLATGFLIKAVGYIWMFVILLGILSLTFFYIVFLLKESLVFERGASQTVWSVEPFVNVYHLFHRGTDASRRWRLLLALFIGFLISFIQLGRTESQILYLFLSPFCFNSVWIGYFSATYYATVSVTIILATWAFVKHIGDVGLILLGSAFGISYELVFGLAVNTLMIFLAPLAGCGMVLPIALLRAYLSKAVGPTEVASAFACFAWIEMIGALLGGTAQNAIFASTASWQPNTVFLFDAGMYMFITVIVLIFLIYLWRLRRRAFRYQDIINYNNESDGEYANCESNGDVNA